MAPVRLSPDAPVGVTARITLGLWPRAGRHRDREVVESAVGIAAVRAPPAARGWRSQPLPLPRGPTRERHAVSRAFSGRPSRQGPGRTSGPPRRHKARAPILPVSSPARGTPSCASALSRRSSCDGVSPAHDRIPVKQFGTPHLIEYFETMPARRSPQSPRLLRRCGPVKRPDWFTGSHQEGDHARSLATSREAPRPGGRRVSGGSRWGPRPTCGARLAQPAAAPAARADTRAPCRLEGVLVGLTAGARADLRSAAPPQGRPLRSSPSQCLPAQGKPSGASVTGGPGCGCVWPVEKASV